MTDPRRVLVLGGASGTGAAIAHSYLADRNEQAAGELLRRQAEQPGGLDFVRADVWQEDDIEHAVRQAHGPRGRPDRVLNGAGLVTDLAAQGWDRTFAVLRSHPR